MCHPIEVRHPERVLAKGEHLGYEWLVTHNSMGHRCGYVRVLPGHPWHGKGIFKIDANAHGGITAAEPDEPCHKGGEDNAWWVGFDCAHAWDKPDMTLPIERAEIAETMLRVCKDGEVRTQEYVEAECLGLCEQAKEAADESRPRVH